MKLVYIAGETQNIAKILMPNGQRHDFRDNGDGSFASPLGVSKTLFQDTDGTYILEEKNGTQYEFDAEGRLTLIADKNGNEVSISLDENGCPNTIKDGAGRIIQITKGPNGKVSSITDFDGRTVSYSYDNDANLVSVTDPLGNVTAFNYDAAHNLTKIVDPNGSIVVSITYNSKGQVSRLIDGEGDFSYAYISSNQTRKTDNSTGGSWIITYDSNEVVTAKQDPLGYTETKLFDSDYNLTSQTDRKGNTTTYTYDDFGNMLTRTDPLGNQWVYTYFSGTHWPETETDPLGVVTNYEYDESGNRIALIRDYNGPTESRWTFTYDAQGRRTSQNDPRGYTTAFIYDDKGNLIQLTDPLGATASFAYDNRGNVVSQTDPNGNTTIYTYDSLDRLLSITDALGNVTAFAYDAVGNKISETDPLGNVTTFTYDAHKQLTQQTDPNGNVIRYSYDAKGNLISITDPLGGTASYTYDEVDNRITATDPLGNVTTYAYDPNGQPVRKTDATGQVTQYTYDAMGRLLSTTDALGNTTAYSYDAIGNLVALSDSNGHITKYEYDRQQWLVKQVLPLLQEENYTYDAAGNLIRKIDAKGQRADYEYDGAGRLIETRYYANAGAAAPLKTVRFTYDAAGNLLGYNDGTTSANYTYDQLNRKTAETVNYGVFSLSNSYGYNGKGLLSSFVGPDNIVYQHTYDGGSRLTRVDIPNVGSIDFNGFRWHRPTTVTLPGGTIRQFDYDALMRVNDITVSHPGAGQLLNYTYTHDPIGNINSKNTEHGSYNYTYDATYRLIQADNPGAADETFTYDPVGNRLTDAQTVGPWSYTANNELTGYDNTSYQYDANGNMIQKTVDNQIIRYYYNLENRLERVENGSGAIIGSYYYDPFGRLLWKEIDGARTYYHYADQGLIGEFDNAGSEIRSYGYKLNTTWSSDPLYLKQGSEYYFYQNDHLGTPQKLTAVNGTVVWAAKYSSFGEATAETETVENNLRFAGQYFDAETGLHYNYHRYYDPNTGRYLTPDPSHTIQPIGTGIPYVIPYLLNTPQELNPYQYVTGDPVNRTDPLGLLSCDGTWRQMGSARIAMWYCLCYWLCIPCDTPVIWSGDYRNLPPTTGQYIYQGGGGLESGDRCFCEKPGSEKDCEKCE